MTTRALPTSLSGHVHGLHHSGTYDSLYGLPVGPKGLPSQHEPVMNGCRASDGVIRNDDIAQAHHEWDNSHVAGVGFENGMANHLGHNWGNWSTSPFNGNSQAVVYPGGLVWNMWTRVTGPKDTLLGQLRHRGFGDQVIHLQFREVDYEPISPYADPCYPTNPHNPNNIVWDEPSGPNVTVSSFTYQLADTAGWLPHVRVFPGPSGGFDTWDAVDVRVGARNRAPSNWLFVDNMEVI